MTWESDQGQKKRENKRARLRHKCQEENQEKKGQKARI